MPASSRCAAGAAEKADEADGAGDAPAGISRSETPPDCRRIPSERYGEKVVTTLLAAVRNAPAVCASRTTSRRISAISPVSVTYFTG